MNTFNTTTMKDLTKELITANQENGMNMQLNNLINNTHGLFLSYHYNNSTKEDLIRAYPNNPIFKSFPNNTTVKKVRFWDKGISMREEEDDSGNKIKRWSIFAFVINGRTNVGGPPSDIMFVWHVQHGDSKPSNNDYDFAYELANNYNYKGNTFVVGVTSNTVTFYNSKRNNIFTISYDDFLMMGGSKK